jgi:hypothetical protein
MISIKNTLHASLLIGFIAVVFTSRCTKENTPTKDLMEKPDTTAMLKFKGNFQNGPFGNNAKGNANIYLKDSMLTLVFDSLFLINNGPALHVYLSKEIQPINYIDLGALKSTNGGQIYSIADMPDFMEFKYALVHCKAYDHLFSYAELK